MKKSKNVIRYEYEHFVEDANTLIKKVKRSKVKMDYIVAIARGGLVLGTVMSHSLNVRLTALSWSTRDSLEKDYNFWIPEIINQGCNVLVVDDIIDSGECLKSLFADWNKSMSGNLNTKNLYVASLIYNEDQDIIPNFYARKISRKVIPDWYEFWWEKI